MNFYTASRNLNEFPVDGYADQSASPGTCPIVGRSLELHVINLRGKISKKVSIKEDVKKKNGTSCKSVMSIDKKLLTLLGTRIRVRRLVKPDAVENPFMVTRWCALAVIFPLI